MNTNPLLKPLQDAVEALKNCYDVKEYPADGTTEQDKAITAAEEAIKKEATP